METPLSHLLDQFFQKHQLQESFLAAKVLFWFNEQKKMQYPWGDKVNALYIEDEKLHLEVAHSFLAQEVLFHQKEICDEIHARFQEVKVSHFKIHVNPQ